MAHGQHWMAPEHAWARIAHDISYPLTVFPLVAMNGALDARGFLRPKAAPGQPEGGVSQQSLALRAERRLGSPVVIRTITLQHGLESAMLAPQALALDFGCPAIVHASITTPSWHGPCFSELTPINVRLISAKSVPAFLALAVRALWLTFRACRTIARQFRVT